MIARAIRFFVEQRLVAFLLLTSIVLWGLSAAPFNLGGPLPHDPVATDALPDLGENQQIVFTRWMGRSPQDIEDQITYPLTVSLLGVPGVRTVRSYSYFGFSSIYVIFQEQVDFYWSRSRILEKLASLPADTLPDGVAPTLGPDATALGQVYWYTLEGRDAEGRPAGGWDLDKLRSVQDWQVRYALASVEGVSEVASVGGHRLEYQVEVDPDAMHAWGVNLDQVYRAVRAANMEVGANVVEINRVEYFLRGLGWLQGVGDLEEAEITTRDGVPVRVRDVAHVTTGPAPRRGALDKGGAEAVGGVVVVRYGENPLAVIERVKAKIAEIAPGLPRVTLEDGTVSQLTIVPFYDRTGLIHETIGTLEEAITLEVLVTIAVILFMLFHLRASLLVSLSLPVAILLCFIMMRTFGVDANIVALSGIAIAIGTIVDMAIVMTENILTRLRESGPDDDRRKVVVDAAAEVGGAVFTAVATTVVGFLPVFAMVGAEGKLFRPLAFTKTFALIASVAVALFIVPPLAATLLARRGSARLQRGRARLRIGLLPTLLALVGVVLLLSRQWEPLGPSRSLIVNLAFTATLVFGLLFAFWLFERAYPRLLVACLRHKFSFLSAISLLVLLGATAWLGFPRVFGFVPTGLEKLGVERETVQTSRPWSAMTHAFPGFGKEFMPDLDEGSFLYMPTTMPHASIGEALELVGLVDRALEAIPEILSAVGKIGRADSALDPAPISMIETVIEYEPEYSVDEDGETVRNWRPEIKSTEDLWQEIVRAAQIPGLTSAPKLQPIAARIVMLQSGMRAPMGLKVKAPDLQTLDRISLELEAALRSAPGVSPDTVFADRVVGKPYLEIEIDRREAARYSLSISDLHDVIETALGGRVVTWTVEERERYAVRVRYPRELRDEPADFLRLLLPTPDGGHVPLGQVAKVVYRAGPQVIKTEDTMLVAYVIFDKLAGFAEVEVVEGAADWLARMVKEGELEVPAGVSWAFAGAYENQVRAAATLRVVLPAALAVIFLILYFHFRSTALALMVFSGVFVAWSGGFLLLWLYGREGFLDFSIFGTNMRELFQVHPYNLSVAVWVGFLALFGIATDDGVVMGTFLQQSVKELKPSDRKQMREAVLAAGKRRVRPCLMTTATTLLALLPVLTSSGRGSDVMIPMAIPSFGGMALAIITMFVVPTLYSAWMERGLPRDAAVPPSPGL